LFYCRNPRSEKPWDKTFSGVGQNAPKFYADAPSTKDPRAAAGCGKPKTGFQFFERVFAKPGNADFSLRGLLGLGNFFLERAVN
jgi:hypothetical protein